MTQTIPSLSATDKYTQLAHLLEQASRLVREIGREQFQKAIPEDQAWFWSKEWQAGEREVDKALKNGDFDTFTTVDELLADLDHHAQSSV